MVNTFNLLKICISNKCCSFEPFIHPEKEISQFTHNLKGVFGCDMHFYKLFELKCVLAVCVHIHPIMIKIHPVFFVLSR